MKPPNPINSHSKHPHLPPKQNQQKMSIDINWTGFQEDGALNEAIREFLDEQFQSLTLPDYLQNIHVAHVSLGSVAPQVTIRHIGDPFEEFYADRAKVGDGVSEHDDDEGDSIRPRNTKPVEITRGMVMLDQSSNVGTSVLGDHQTATSNTAANETTTEPKDTADERSKDIQFLVEIEYKGDISIEVQVDLLLNYPSPGFIKLPVKLRIVDLGIHSLAVVSHVANVVYLSFLCDVTDDQFDSLVANPSQLVYADRDSYRSRIDIIRTLRIESEIGDSKGDGSVLRNVGKVEKFLTEMLRQMLRDELAWPGWISLDFNDEDENED